MPRTKRVMALDAALHVICRGNNRVSRFMKQLNLRKAEKLY